MEISNTRVTVLDDVQGDAGVWVLITEKSRNGTIFVDMAFW